MGSIKSFKELEIWKKGIELVKEIYALTENFPSAEVYGLTSQMRRCSISIPSNVAEGFKRRHAKEFKQFLNIALGSLAELETQIIIAEELHYSFNGKEALISELIDHLNRMIVSLSKKL